MTMLRRAEKQGKKFLNPVPTRLGGFSMIFKVLPRYLSTQEEKTPRAPLGPFRTDKTIYATKAANGLRVTWFGHSSTLLEIDGVRILIDPVWDERAAPTQWFGPKRFFSPSIALEDLPAIDAVLISHDHYDHLGEGTVRRFARLQPKARWLAPMGVGHILQRFGVPAEQIAELDWTQSVSVAGGACAVIALPARHFSGRSLFNRFETLWGSFVIRGAKHSVYYGADSGWWEGFMEVGSAYGPFDLTMLEIGAFNELWKDIHMGPDGAAEAYDAIGGPSRAGLLMPIHWGLFDLALHNWRQPVERVLQLAAQHGWPLFLPEPGRPSEVAVVESMWWR